ELLLADLQHLENLLPKAERNARSQDKEAKAKLEVLKKCLAHLAAEQPIRTLELTPVERKSIKELGLLSAKPILYVANVDETDLAGAGPLVEQVRQAAAASGADVVAVCAKLEAELAELDEADRAEMLADVGLTEPALGVLARGAYKTLGLQSFFTAGEGVIHTDFEKGFIRAEIYSVEDLEALGSEKEIRAAGKLRVEGKEYVMHDGDVCHFLFNR
ncbi:MAG: DUF933 domain-containing protein, partial [Planctomycetia bacterium]|nr:DUF933 domain-containing protein [Planctomycetia bacterium]